MKLPVAHSLGNRLDSLDKDSLMRNAFAEVDEESKVIRARKRPAIDSAFTATTGKGQALFNWERPGPLGPEVTLIAISDDVLITSPPPIVKALRFTVQPS